MQLSDLTHFPPLQAASTQPQPTTNYSKKEMSKSGLGHINAIEKAQPKPGPQSVVSKHIADELKEQLNKASDRNKTLIRQANLVCETTGPFLRSLMEKSLDEKEKAQLQSLIIQHEALKEIANPSKNPAAKAKGVNNPRQLMPIFLSLQTNLDTIGGKLESVLKQIDDPQSNLEEQQLLTILHPLSEQFEKEQNLFKENQKQILRKLKGLEDKVKQQEDRSTLEKDIPAIARYEGKPEEAIRQKIEKSRSQLIERKARHDELCSLYASCKIRVDSVAWMIHSIRLYAQLQATLKFVENGLGGLIKSIEDLKTLMRKHGSDHLSDRKTEFNKLVEEYNNLKELAVSYKERVNTELGDLDSKIQSCEPNKALVEFFSQLNLWEPVLLVKSREDTLQKLKVMHNQTKVKHQGISQSWKTIWEILTGKPANDLNRIGYALNENNGSIPWETTFRARTFFVEPPVMETAKK